MDNKIIIINSRCGLCNRLRFMLQFFKILKEKKIIHKKSIYVIWPIDEMCNGFYLDYFQNIKDNIIFLKNEKDLENYIRAKKLKKIKKINDINYKFILSKDKNYLQYKFFKINRKLYDKIKNIIKKMNNRYISVHVRRTDLDKHLLGYRKELNHKRTSDEEFFKFVRKYKDYSLYIATDNYETQELFIKKFKKKIKYIKIIKNVKDRRKTNLEDAIIDLFVCSCGHKFKGTFFSSFSDFIKLIRLHIDENRRINKKRDPLRSLKMFI